MRRVGRLIPRLPVLTALRAGPVTLCWHRPLLLLRALGRTLARQPHLPLQQLPLHAPVVCRLTLMLPHRHLRPSALRVPLSLHLLGRRLCCSRELRLA